jgi:hypothetical protein
VNWKPSAALLAGLMVVAIGVGVLVAGGIRPGTAQVSPSPSPSTATGNPAASVSPEPSNAPAASEPDAAAGASPSPTPGDAAGNAQPSSPPDDPIRRAIPVERSPLGDPSPAVTPSDTPGQGGVVLPSTLAVTFVPPGTLTVVAGNAFAVGVWLSNPTSQALDAVEVHLDFDPAKLELLQQPPSELSKETLPAAPSIFPLVLQQRTDPAAGQIDLAFGRDLQKPPPTEGAELGRFYFRPRPGATDARITAVRSGDRATRAAYRGEALTMDTSLASLVVSAAP